MTWRAGAAMLAGLLCAGCESTAAINRTAHTGSTTAVLSNGAQQVRVVVDDTYRFSPSTITVHPGTVHVTLVHQGSGAPHDLQVLGFPADFVPLVSAGQTTQATFTAPSPGTYTFVCTIHVAQGQTGTLIVLPT